MVFQKKGATAIKNSQPKKKGRQQVEADDDIDMFDDMDDSDDFEDDSDDDLPVQKTPQGKTPQKRNSMSEKKVTFDMPGKNTPGKKNSLAVGTPGKTPNKHNAAIKGKGALQEFKGIKGKPQQKKGEAEEDDDDQDEDDDEEDEDLDLEMDDDEGGEEDEDDDDDDDEEEEDDDEDDDDDDEEEEEEQKPKQKQGNKQKTPVKNENAKNQTSVAKTPKKGAGSPLKNPETQSIEIQRRKERDSKMLYVGGLPKDVTAEELQALSSDIKTVIIPKSNRKNMRTAYGFLCFASEAKAEANYKTLQGKKFRGQLLNIDLVGEKSKKKPSSSSLEPKINERKLYVTGISLDATLAQVAAHFPKAYQVSFNRSPSFRSASINFAEIEDATEAFNSNKDIVINGQKLIVVHSTVSTMNKKYKKKRPQKNMRNSNANLGGNPAKKMKFNKKEESNEE